MKIATFVIGAVTAGCCTFLDLSAECKVNASASLKDGTIIKGEMLTKSISGSSLFSEKLSLPANIVRSIAFKGTNGVAKVELVNKDSFSMTIADKSYKLKSSLGELNIPCVSIKSLNLSARKVGSTRAEGLVFYCTFDDESAITSPAVGPAGKVGTGKFVEGKVDNAVLVPEGCSAGFFTFPAGMLREEGCIEFWAKIDVRKKYFSCCDPRMVFVKSPGGWFTVEYSSNNGQGQGGFFVRCFGYSYIHGYNCGMRYDYASILGPNTSDWHHYAFSWTKDTMKTYIDGKLLDMRKCENGATINSDALTGNSATMGLPNENTRVNNTEPNSPFTIDELKIWNYPKTEFDTL